MCFEKEVAIIHVAVASFLQWIEFWNGEYYTHIPRPAKSVVLYSFACFLCDTSAQFSRFALGLLPFLAAHHTWNGNGIGGGHVISNNEFTLQSSTVYLYLRDSILLVSL